MIVLIKGNSEKAYSLIHITDDRIIIAVSELDISPLPIDVIGDEIKGFVIELVIDESSFSVDVTGDIIVVSEMELVEDKVDEISIGLSFGSESFLGSTGTCSSGDVVEVSEIDIED